MYSLLDEAQRKVELVDAYANCRPGASLSLVPHFIWRRLFTFNIDDVLEVLYGSTPSAKQTLIPLNFDAPFEPTPDRPELLAVHLHGWTGQPDHGFVFSYTEYARVMTTMNPWMHLLSEILATESFIIAGTSLNEIDLEYYLSYRSEATPRRGRGPSLLIEPYPDTATEADCKRYGLVLVKATFGAFLEWLHQQFPAPPSISELIVPDVRALFNADIRATRFLRFFADFKQVVAGDSPKATSPSPFLYGREPQQDDLDQHIDIPRADNGLIQAQVETMLESVSHGGPRLLIALDEAGAGKSTVISRIGHDLARRGRPVLAVHTLSRIDAQNALDCLSTTVTPILLLADGVADHAEQIHELLADPRSAGKLVVLAAERSYRQELVDVVLGDLIPVTRHLQPLDQHELRQLIELFDRYGLVANKDAIRDSSGYARRLRGDPVAIAVCRILNDFRPLEAIVSSLWTESPQELQLPYLCVALSQRCHTAGVRYSILQSLVGTRLSLSRLFAADVALRITENREDHDYVVTMNAVIGERVLQRIVRRDPALLLRAFQAIARGLAPHVNRRAMMLRSPEARLAGRLFDADKIVKPLLGQNAEPFYISCQEQWRWNSRYWEQRALLIADADLDTAVRYARHAIAIEWGPFPLTTLGKLLLRQMEHTQPPDEALFNEAFDNLATAIRKEDYRSRIRIHPYVTLFAGASRFVEGGGSLTSYRVSA